MYYQGYGVEQDYAEAINWLERAYMQGESRAECIIDLMYPEAVKWYKKVAAQGCAHAQCKIGIMYAGGDRVEQDYAEAAKWFEKAAKQGFAKAQYLLGLMYDEGDGVEQDYTEAVKWYKKAAEQGYADSQCNLGGMYYEGRGVERDYSEAVKWYQKAAEQGYADAQCNLGNMYYKGYGVEQDYSEAVKWYKKAAEQGQVGALRNLGNMYAYGYGVEQDYSEAFKWYRKLFDQEQALEFKSLKEKISEINREKSELLAKNNDLNNYLNSCIEETENIQSKLDETQNKNEKLNSDLFAIKSKFDSLQFGLIKGTKQVIASVDGFGLSIAKSFTKDKYQLTPSDCLRLISMLGGERVLVLNSAYESASKVDDYFKNGHRLLVLLCKLITFYYDAYIEKGDTLARTIFTNDELASNESETIRNSNNDAYLKDRKVIYNGNEVKMVHHLKIGRDHNVQHTIRVYFFFDQEEKKIVIGYCGAHPTITQS